MPDLRDMLKNEIIFLDGATGTNLQKAGMPAGVCPELWILEHPRVLLELQRSYVEAGTQILYAPTFSGNAIKLEEYGVRNRLKEINQRLVALSRRAAGDNCLVAGNLTMTGRSLAPVGDLDFEELVDCYKEQVRAIAEAGVDLFVIETMMSIQECRAAVLAVKETCDLPVFVTITLEGNGRTLYGTDPVTALVTMEALGVEAFGINCSCGPDRLIPIVKELSEYAGIPLIAKPNAGLPRLENGRTVFDMPKEEFAEHMAALAEAGASVLGGCCGTDPSYIAAMKKCVLSAGTGRCATDGSSRAGGSSSADRGCTADNSFQKRRILTGERGRVEFTLNGAFHIIGERINPTGKKKLQAELREGSLQLVSEMAREQAAQGASVLDVNVGTSGIDEHDMMIKVIEEVSGVVDTPLCIDSGNPDVVAAALRRYPGRALVNSVSCERIKIEKLLPVVKKYGAMFILLPLRDEGLPKNRQERWENIQYVLEKAYELGFSKEDVLVDGLVAAVAAEPSAALDTLNTIGQCHEEGLATVCGLSNISFGLPDRSYVNSVFLSMAIDRGLTMAIANPSQELFRRSCLAADLLMNRENAAVRYVEYCNRVSDHAAATESGKSAATESGKSAATESGSQAASEKTDRSQAAAERSENSGTMRTQLQEEIRQDVLKGRTKQIAVHIKDALELSNVSNDVPGEKASDRTATEADHILNQVLIPAINEVGELFNRQKYFLPQLIISAKAMEAGVAVLEPILQEKNKGAEGPVVVIATVKGDIHDIGKNLVAMMMKNYGFRVIDLGKDVDKETIIAAAKEHQAAVIGLSALMTTTMSYMKEVITAVKEEGLSTRVIVGGAAVTEDYAREIGADGYSEDAVGAVELVKRLTENKKQP